MNNNKLGKACFGNEEKERGEVLNFRSVTYNSFLLANMMDDG